MIQEEGGRHVVKWRSGPQVAHREVKVQVRDLVRVVGNFAPFSRVGVQYSGKIRFMEPRRVDGHRRPEPCARSSGISR